MKQTVCSQTSAAHSDFFFFFFFFFFFYFFNFFNFFFFNFFFSSSSCLLLRVICCLVIKTSLLLIHISDLSLQEKRSIAHITIITTTSVSPLHHYDLHLLSIHLWAPPSARRTDGPPLTWTVRGGDPPAQRRRSGAHRLAGTTTEGERPRPLPSPATPHAGPTSPAAMTDLTDLTDLTGLRRSGRDPERVTDTLSHTESTRTTTTGNSETETCSQRQVMDVSLGFTCCTDEYLKILKVNNAHVSRTTAAFWVF